MTRRTQLDALARDAFGPRATVDTERVSRTGCDVTWVAEVWCGGRFELAVERRTRPAVTEALADVLRGVVARRRGTVAA